MAEKSNINSIGFFLLIAIVLIFMSVMNLAVTVMGVVLILLIGAFFFLGPGRKRVGDRGFISMFGFFMFVLLIFLALVFLINPIFGIFLFLIWVGWFVLRYNRKTPISYGREKANKAPARYQFKAEDKVKGKLS